jgi:hypothetical protein
MNKWNARLPEKTSAACDKVCAVDTNPKPEHGIYPHNFDLTNFGRSLVTL